MKTLAILLALAAGPAYAQEQPLCADHAHAMKLLEERHMHVVAAKTADNGTVYKIYQAYSGEYAVIAISPDGTRACLLERGIAKPSYEV